MKKAIYAVLACLTFASCEDFLDKQPIEEIGTDNFFKDESSLLQYTNGFINSYLPSATELTFGDGNCDIVQVIETSNYLNQPSWNSALQGGWGNSAWKFVYYINTFLERMHEAEGLSEETYAHYEGTARFWRAWNYFELVKTFGAVPWYDYVILSTDTEALYKPRDSREYVMDKVLEDLNYACEHCFSSSEWVNNTKINKWIALGIKSRICLFEGTYRKYHGIADYERFLNECATVSEQFIDQSPYSIYQSGDKPYRDLFASMDAIKQEVILARDYDATKAVKHEANYYTMSTTYGRPGMNKKIVNSYLMKDGSRFTDIPGYDEMQYYDEMQNRDPRLTQTVVGPGYMRINSDAVMSPDFTASTTGYQIIKWVTDASGDGYLGSSNDYILFRAAEVYLNFAEAKAELGTLTQADLDKSIKKIRDRVGMPNIDLAAANANPDPYLTAENSGYHNVTGANKGVILEIRRERTIELILEGFRYYDLMRWKEGKMLEQPFMGMYFPGLTEGSGEDRYGIFDMNDGTLQDSEKVDICIYTGKKPSVKNIRKFYKLDEVFTLTGGDNGNIICHDIAVEPREFNEERDYLYPIPTTERSLTNGALTQNPGWDDGLSF